MTLMYAQRTVSVVKITYNDILSDLILYNYVYHTVSHVCQNNVILLCQVDNNIVNAFNLRVEEAALFCRRPHTKLAES